MQGPLQGTLYYGRFRGDEFAVADFARAGGSPIHQAFFLKTREAGKWEYLPSIGGHPTDVGAAPCPVLKVWGFAC